MKNKYYCGPYWAPNWLKKILSVKFNASCKVHDLDYASPKFSRDKADSRFHDHMNKQAKHNLFWRTVAFLFYVAVRIGGSLSWKHKE